MVYGNDGEYELHGGAIPSPSPLALKTMLDLRLPLAVGAKKGKGAAEIQCKGSVVRVERSQRPETPIALAVAIRDYRIVRNAQLPGSPRGIA